jgi:hypothetical protein
MRSESGTGMKTGSSKSKLGAGEHFVTTHWSAVTQAGCVNSVSAREALIRRFAALGSFFVRAND